MNRIIKFRGKRVDGKGWVYGHLLTRDIDTGDVYIRELNPDNVPPRYTDYLVHPSTVGQFTGLTDRNGTEIFEGDVIESKAHNPSCMMVQFIEGGFCAEADNILPIDINHFYPSIGCQIEVIGNIHEPVNSK